MNHKKQGNLWEKSYPVERKGIPVSTMAPLLEQVVRKYTFGEFFFKVSIKCYLAPFANSSKFLLKESNIVGFAKYVLIFYISDETDQIFSISTEEGNTLANIICNMSQKFYLFFSSV